MIIYIDFLVYLYTSFLHFSFLTSTIPLRSIFKCINISKSRQNLNWRKFEKSESLTNLWFKWNFHGNWYFSLSNVWGPGKPPAERRDARSCHSFLFFAFSLLVPSVLLPTRYPSLVLVFFFFWLSFLRPSRQQTTWRAPRTLCPREARRFSKLLNVSLFSSFTLIRKKKMDERSFA